MLLKHLSNGATNQLPRDRVGPFQFPFVLQLKFAGHGRQCPVQVHDSGNLDILFVANRPPLGVRGHIFYAADGHSLAHPGALVNLLVRARQKSNLLHHLADKAWHDQPPPVAGQPRLLLRDGNPLVQVRRIMRTNLRADAVLQGSDNLSARRVVLRVGRKDQRHVQRQADREPLNLDIAFLHDVEQPYLNFPGQVRQLIDGKNAAIGPGKQAEVDVQFIGKLVPASRRLDGIDVPDHVGDGHVRCGQFLHITKLPGKKSHRRGIAFLCQQQVAGPADGRIGIVVDFTPCQYGQLLIEQAGEGPQDAALGLPAQPQQDEVVTREDGVDNLRNHRIVVSDDPGKKRIGLLQVADQVLPHLVLHRTVLVVLLRELALAKFSQSFWLGFHCFAYPEKIAPVSAASL